MFNPWCNFSSVTIVRLANCLICSSPQLTKERFALSYFAGIQVTMVGFCAAVPALFLPRFSCFRKVALYLPLLKDNWLTFVCHSARSYLRSLSPP